MISFQVKSRAIVRRSFQAICTATLRIGEEGGANKNDKREFCFPGQIPTRIKKNILASVGERKMIMNERWKCVFLFLIYMQMSRFKKKCKKRREIRFGVRQVIRH